jgi:DNA-binding MarR family transcriptional regulator
MPSDRIVHAVERVIYASVGLTTRAIDASPRAGDLTLAQWRVLAVLNDSRGPLRVTDVAERVGLSLPSASRLLARVTERGLISSETDERDRRALLVSLSDDGRNLLDEVLAIRRGLVRDALAGLNGDLHDGFADRLEELARGLGKLAVIAVLVGIGA